MRWWQIRKRDADLERELRSDLELEEEEQRENGVPPEEARYAARRAFGNTTLIREQTHEAWGWAAFERLSQDIRYALRQLLEVARIRCCCDNDACSWYRRDNRAFYPDQRCDASSAALCPCGPARDRRREGCGMEQHLSDSACERESLHFLAAT